MRDQIIFYLSAEITTISWIIVHDNQIIESVYAGEIDALTQAAVDKEIIVLVPAQDVVLTSAHLPKMHAARLRQALPFSLEEQLIAEVETLHFAMGERDAANVLPTAIVSKEKMQTWLDLLSSWKIVPDRLYPLSLALPFDAQGWTVSVMDVAVIRMNAMQALTCEVSQLPDYLKALSLPKEPSFIDIHHFTEQSMAALFPFACDINEIKHARDAFLKILFEHLQKPPIINLLQGDYVIKKKKWVGKEKIIRSIKYVSAAWLFLLFLYPVVSSFILQRRLHQIDNEIDAIYHKQFPHATNIVEPKIRLKEKLKEAMSNQEKNRLFLWLADLGRGLSIADIHLNRLDFQNDQLTVEFSAASTEAVTQYVHFLMQQGLNVKQQSASLNENRIQAVMVIEP